MDSGDTAWVLTSAALVLLMTPGLALFYGGMVRSKNVLNMLLANFFTISMVTLTWILIGFTLAFAPDAGGGIIGNLHYLGLKNVTGAVLWTGTKIPDNVFMAFQLMFAVITTALITGAVAERMKFSAWVVYGTLWSLLIYPVVAHWAFAADGWIFKMGARDFAGGLVVHANAGAAALACVLVVGTRRGFPREPVRPHSLPLTLLGTGILWFGWFGFNAGSALAANRVAGSAFIATQVAASLGALGWVGAEWVQTGKPTLLGAASGAIAGLATITACAGFVPPLAALVIGFAAGVLCYLAASLKFRCGFDDALDVVAVHLVGGLAGAILLGVFAQYSINPTGLTDGSGHQIQGLIYGDAGFFLKQIVASFAVLLFSFVASYILAQAVNRVMGLRVTEQQELTGLDRSLQEEQAYHLTES